MYAGKYIRSQITRSIIETGIFGSAQVRPKDINAVGMCEKIRDKNARKWCYTNKGKILLI